MRITDTFSDVIGSSSNTSNQVNRVCEATACSMSSLESAAVHVSRRLNAVQGGNASKVLMRRYSRCFHAIVGSLREIASLRKDPVDESPPLVENERLLRTILQECEISIKAVRRLPQVESQNDPVPRVYAAARAFLEFKQFNFKEEDLKTFFEVLQDGLPFRLGELWALRPMLLLVVLEQIALYLPCLDYPHCTNGKHSHLCSQHCQGLQLLRTLRKITDSDWNELSEDLSAVHKVLCLDPQGAYAQMDFESRLCYRGVVEALASRAHISELSAAAAALELTKTVARKTANIAHCRRAHIGYFLMDKGRAELERTIGCQPSWQTRIARVASGRPTLFYLSTLTLFTALAMFFLLCQMPSTLVVLQAGSLLLIPISQGVIEITNQLFSFLFRPPLIPKLDYSSGIPAQCSTMVVVPTILTDTDQVQRLARELEIRYFANRDANLHFALVTDFPDSPSPIHCSHVLVTACSTLIADLDKKYWRAGGGRFFHFHRHQVYEQSELRWMGWERKRGKLIEFNELLRGRSDAFPIKVGDLSLLPRIKYVISLDEDTKLPPNSARKLVAAMAHPLNRPVVDWSSKTVTEGYGILQPRIEVSAHSASSSRLAKIFSGRTGFDIYTNAVSNVYQDLCGEGTFTGKGIYEVDVFQTVVAKTFPSNLLLSHDLLEGCYARTGLVTDVELIDDYPSQCSAFAKRKHRWVRGDWQVMFCLLPWVPGPKGGWVSNPITALSRWKILDNLRRSLLEISIVLLLLGGWLILPGGTSRWTATALGLVTFPLLTSFFFSLAHKKCLPTLIQCLEKPLSDLLTGLVQVFVLSALLACQALIAADAILRSLWRLSVSHRSLLDWETSARCESQKTRAALLRTALMYSSISSFLVGCGLLSFRSQGSLAALPLLGLWASARVLCDWLDRPVSNKKTRITQCDQDLLRETALRTWFFFSSFSSSQNHWLVPDSVWEQSEATSTRTSATNMGPLLNSRIVAYELGYVTVEEFIVQTEKTLSTLQRLEKYRGHWFNWYNTRTLQPEQPRFISTVDSGNLAACLLTLKQACLGISLQPISMDLLWQGLTDHVHLLLTLVSSVQLPKMPELQALEDFLRETGTWKTKHCLYGLAGSLAKLRDNCDNQLIRNSELTCVISETLSRINAIHLAFAEVGTGNRVTNNGFAQNAADVLPPSIKERLLRIVEQLEFMVSSMDFSFLSSARKGLLSVGYDYDRQMLHESSYDLLASEARTALFIAIAKGDLPVKTWLNLGRAHARIHNRNMLLSWAGTMFEYMMPNLWMKLFPGSLIEQTARSVVRIQSRFAKDLGMPWGLSEAACSEPAADGSYEYLAFGVRELSLRVCGPTQMAVSPYSSFLASLVDSKTSLENIRSIKEFAWQGRFGFYEAAVIAGSRSGSASRGKLVRCWMAHHQGMILLAICNLLLNFIVQDMFHCEPMIAASERILEEQFPPSARVDDSEKWRALMKKNRRKSRSSLTESPTKSCTKILIRM